MSRGADVEPRTLTLADGRTLAFDVYGDPAGRPVLNCHGGLLCRTDVAPADAAAREAGICVVSPDRPGVGRSARRPMATTSDWVADAAALADHLGYDRFAVMGWSLGGQYALAVAAGLPDRVTRAAVIAGALPLDDRARFAQLSGLDRNLARLSRKVPAMARGAFALMRAYARRAPAALARGLTKGSPKFEVDAVRADADRIAASMVEGLRDTHGAVDEYRTFVAAWGFAPEDVDVDVDLWQGGADRLVPASWAQELHERLPRSTLHAFEGEGHMIALTRRAEVLAAL